MNHLYTCYVSRQTLLYFQSYAKWERRCSQSDALLNQASCSDICFISWQERLGTRECIPIEQIASCWLEVQRMALPQRETSLPHLSSRPLLLLPVE